MREIWQRLAWDVRRLKWLLALLWVAALGHGAVDAVLLRRASEGVAIATFWMSRVEWLLLVKAVAVFLLVGRLIQSEGNPGSGEVSSLECKWSLKILASHLIFVAVAMLLPLMLENGTVLVTLGIESSRIGAVIAETALIWGAPIIALMLAASLTRRLWSYAFACGGTMLFMIVSVLAYATLKFLLYRWTGWERVTRSSFGYSELTSAALILAGVLTLSLAALLVLHYAMGRSRLTLDLAIVLWIGCLLAVDWCRWDWVEAWAYRSAVNGQPWSDDAVTVSVDPDSVRKREGVYSEARQASDVYLSVKATVQTGEPGVFCCPAYARSQWSVEGKSRGLEQLERCYYAPSRQEPQLLEAVLPGVWVVNPQPLRPPSYVIRSFRFSNSEYEQCKDVAGTLELKLDLPVWRYRKIAELPLRAGAESRDGSTRVKIVNVGRTGAGINLDVAVTRPDKWFAISDSFYSWADQSMLFLLVNSQRKEAYRGTQDSGGPVLNYPDAHRGYVLVAQGTLRFPASPANASLAFKPLTDEWLRDAVLVCVRMERVGNIVKDVSVPGLVLGEIKPLEK